MATAEPSGGQDHREVEWQLDADDLDAVDRWVRARPADATPRAEAGSVRELRDTYLDTDDWRLFRAGWVLRVRRDGERCEVTLKSREPAVDARRDRREISQDVPDASPASMRAAHGPVGERVRAVAGDRELRPLFDVHTRRRAYALAVEGSVAGELALDDTTIPAAGDEPDARIRRVEVELAGDDRAGAVERLVEEVRAACALRPAARSKFEAGLRASSLAPPGLPLRHEPEEGSR